MKIFFFLSFFLLTTQTKIRNVNFPCCRDCKYFKPITGYSYGNECTYFGTKNIINGQYTYEDAKECRKDKEKCGEEGNYFEEIKGIQKIKKNTKYYIKDNLYWILIFPLVFLEIMILLIKK